MTECLVNMFSLVIEITRYRMLFVSCLRTCSDATPWPCGAVRQSHMRFTRRCQLLAGERVLGKPIATHLPTHGTRDTPTGPHAPAAAHMCWRVCLTCGRAWPTAHVCRRGLPAVNVNVTPLTTRCLCARQRDGYLFGRPRLRRHDKWVIIYFSSERVG